MSGRWGSAGGQRRPGGIRARNGLSSQSGGFTRKGEAAAFSSLLATLRAGSNPVPQPDMFVRADGRDLSSAFG